MSSVYYNIDYRFTSSLDDDSASNYITSCEGNILEVDIETEKEIIVGKLKLDLLNLNLAYDNNFPVIEIFESDTQFVTMAKYIYDIKESDFKEEIRTFYDDVYTGNNICLIRQIELIDSHRKSGIGTKVLKDIFNKFSSSCSLFVVEAYPLQFNRESINPFDNSEVDFAEKMNYDSLSKDFEKSFYKLKAFYQKSGFNHIEGFDKWMFANPGILNDKLNKKH